jgi:ammonium transporter, Amt family
VDKTVRIILLRKSARVTAWAGLATLVLAGTACAQGGASKIDTGDTAWVLACAALVMLMTPGLGLFYAGMVRRKNALGTILQSFAMVAVIGVQWVVYGYSLAFGPGISIAKGFVGGLAYIGLRGVGPDPGPYAPTIPHTAFMIYQAMFAIITPALITGAFAERMRFKSFLIFMILWATLVYDPVAHWVWAKDGWLAGRGVLDFAGGTVVHICSGVAALCCALVMGKRKGYGREEFIPHGIWMTVVGAALLWFGWFGFNAGSALGANGLAANAFVVTNTAAAMGALSWMFIEWWHRGKPTALGAASGGVAGLVAITPASGYVGPMAAIAIGAVVGGICYGAILLKSRLRYDDSLDVFGVHGVGGMWGAIATGLFASVAVNAGGKNGVFYGGYHLIGQQFIAIGAVLAYSFIVTAVLLKLVGLVSPLRVEKGDEEMGLDLSQHGEVAYNL